MDTWRADLLRVVLPAGGCSLVLSWLALWADPNFEDASQFEYFIALGCILALSSPLLVRAPRTAGWVFVSSMMVPVSHAILVLSWAPGVVAILVFLTTFAGLLVGRAATYLMVGGASLMFCLGGLVARGSIELPFVSPLPPVPPSLDVTSFSNWVRVTLVFLGFTAASGWGIGRLFELIGESSAYYANQVALLRERQALLLVTRSERSEKITQLQDAQRFQMVAQLGQGFQQLFGDTLRLVRKVLSRMNGGDDSALSYASQQILQAVFSTASRSQDVLALLRPHHRVAESVDLSQLVSTVAYKFRAQLPAHVTLEVDAPPVEHANMSESWIEQVLLNLLLNAVRALDGKRGTINVQVRRLFLREPHPSTCGTLEPGTYAVIRVQDNGPGISPEAASRAFEPFYSQWGPPQLGIGLTTVFEMLRKARGSVEIERPEAGASVAVYVPLASSEADPPPRSTRAMPANVVPEWKERSLRKVAVMAAICTAVAMAAAEVQRWTTPNISTSHLLIGAPLLAAYWFVARSSASYFRRLSYFVGSVFVAALLFVASVGFMAPAGIAGLSLAILFTWALGSARISVGGLLLAAVGLLLLGVLFSSGVLHPAATQTNLATARNWFRVAVSLPSIALIGAVAVLNLVEAARNNVTELAALQTALLATERQLSQETASVSNIDRITARATELEALGRMTGAVAHDVNNSLQAITAWASMLSQLPVRDADVREAVEAIEEAVSHAEGLLADLDSSLDLASNVVVDLAEQTRLCERLLKALLSSKHALKLEVAGPAAVRTNSQAYQRALFNLVSNARDAMNAPGTCTIRVSPEHNVVTVVVEDDGTGMDESTRSKLFDPYFTTKGDRGHGLGLLSVAALTADSGGAVRTWSEPGKGTRITLTFPRAN